MSMIHNCPELACSRCPASYATRTPEPGTCPASASHCDEGPVDWHEDEDEDEEPTTQALANEIDYIDEELKRLERQMQLLREQVATAERDRLQFVLELRKRREQECSA